MSIAPSHKAIAAYYAELEQYETLGARYEQATRAAFQKLLSAFAHPVAGWTLLLEQPLANGKRPDGTLRDAFNLPRGYWEAKEYPLTWRFTPGMVQDWRLKKMKLTQDKTAVVYNEWVTLEGVPAEAFDYRLGNRSALEWVIDQYQVSTDARSGIVSDPNRSGSEEERQYIARLVGRVVMVSVETVRLVRALAAQVDLLAAVGVESVLPV